MSDDLAELLNLEPLNQQEPIKKTFSGDEYQDAKAGLEDTIAVGSRAMNELSEIAYTSQHPRSYEVLATLIRSMVEANRELVAIKEKDLVIQKKQKELVEGKDPSTINNNLIVASTDEILKAIQKG